MCPNRQIISLYYDGELPSPWKEKMASHLETCSECCSRLSEYGRLGACLQNRPEETGEAAYVHTAHVQGASARLDAARERVWKNLTAPELAAPGNASARASGGVKSPWNRSVTIPLPAAAAALLAVALSFAFIGLRSGNRAPAQDSMMTANIANIGLDDRGTVPVQDMNEVLQYLSNQDSGDFMVIRLPESRKFSRAGEPALINAADYSRRNVLP